MTRDSVPAPNPSPAPTVVPRQPVAGLGLSTAVVQGAAQGAVRSVVARAVDKLLSSPPDWLKVLWDMLPRP